MSPVEKGKVKSRGGTWRCPGRRKLLNSEEKWKKILEYMFYRNYEKYRKRRETEAIPHEIAVDEEKKYRPEAM